jgi:hypothetical protein
MSGLDLLAQALAGTYLEGGGTGAAGRAKRPKGQIGPEDLCCGGQQYTFLSCWVPYDCCPGIAFCFCDPETPPEDCTGCYVGICGQGNPFPPCC